jgi:glycosyltransferase involved in cell wall biosynthesis/2-polyprenyl-3-methyl-5-hydroxy-6-metoxy-1,4-benzoquinol methylase
MVKPLRWTPQLVQQFWDGVAQIDSMESMSFARLNGPALIEFMTPWIPADGEVLDFGGGSGHLVRLLLSAGYSAAATDPSAKRQEAMSRIVSGDSRFLGLIAPTEQRGFDFVICTEVIEHVLEEDMLGFMRALRRRVKPGGRLMLSTPFQEDLGNSRVYCPVCDHSFHRWQHQRSWTVAQICALMEQHGFVTEWVGLVGFADITPIRDFNQRRRMNEDWPWGHTLSDGQVVPIIGGGNHIVYIGTTEHAMSLENPERLLAAGIQWAQRLGAEPIVVVPSRSVTVNAQTVIVAEDLLGAADMVLQPVPGPAREPLADAALNNGKSMLVFPAPLERLARAVDDGRLPHMASALVFEGGEWRCVKQSRRHTLNVAPVRRRRVTANLPGVDRHFTNAARALREMPWARRLQPRFDRREDVVATTLQHPGDFPFRMSHAIDGRVLLAIGTLGSGGAERQLVNTAEGLRSHGVDDVHVLVNYLYDDPSKAFYLERAKAVARSVHETPKDDYSATRWVRAQPELRQVLGDWLLSLMLNDAAVIRKLSPEVVHASLDWTNITVGMAAVLAGVPHVFLSGRNLSPLYFAFFQWFMYPCYRALARCSGVHFLNNSDAGRRDYARWLRIEPERISVLRNGLHTSDFSPVDDARRDQARTALGLPSSAKVVAGALRLSPEKQPLLWIDTAAQIQRQCGEATFLLCGIGPMEEQVRQHAAAKGLDGRIQFLGAHSDIHTVLAASDLVLQTSLQEGTPNVLIEAQACGIPVVTTPAFGAAEAVEDGVTGRVVAGSATVLADAALSMLRDESARLRARVSGPRFIESRFGFDRMIRDTLAAYHAAGVRWAGNLLPAELRYRQYARLMDIRADSGHGWLVELPHHQAFSDSLTHGDRSTLVVMEDDRILGPPHSTHDTVRNIGNGAYSHWGDCLYFSSSDNSDPTRNGRIYAVFLAL